MKILNASVKKLEEDNIYHGNQNLKRETKSTLNINVGEKREMMVMT